MAVLRKGRAERHSILFQYLMLGVQVIATLVGMVTTYTRYCVAKRWSVHRIVGLICILPPFLLWIRARYELATANAFTVMPVAPKKLCTDGLYSITKHPIYIFSGLYMYAYLLFMSNFKYILLFVCLYVPIQYIRARSEDLVLSKKFGYTYEEYSEDHDIFHSKGLGLHRHRNKKVRNDRSSSSRSSSRDGDHHTQVLRDGEDSTVRRRNHADDNDDSDEYDDYTNNRHKKEKDSNIIKSKRAVLRSINKQVTAQNSYNKFIFIGTCVLLGIATIDYVMHISIRSIQTVVYAFFK